MRIYDPRLGRFLSVDPLTKTFSMLSPFQYAANRPIDGIDLDGLEWKKIETYDPKTGVTNIHFQVSLKVANDSKVFKDVQVLKDEIQKQFSNAFKDVKSTDSKTSYSASIDVTFDNNPQKNDYAVILADFEKGPMKGFSTGVNTQVNAFSVSGGEYEEGNEDNPTSRDAKSMANDIVHELLHTGNVRHPDDDDNNALDVDLEPDKYEIKENGKRILRSYKLGPKATLENVIHNIMLYNFKVIDGKKVTEYEPDKYNRGKASPDQAKIIAEQITKDTKTKN